MSPRHPGHSTLSKPHLTPEKPVQEGFEQNGSHNPTAAQFVPIGWIVPPQYQPRQHFDEDAMQQLNASVREHGILQPLLVRPTGDRQYELVAGERRYKAAQAAGLAEVPVVVRELTDFEALQVALIENLNRGDLNPVEEAEGILQLLALHLECEVKAVISRLYNMKNVLEKQSKSKPVVAAISNSQASDKENILALDESALETARENVFPNRAINDSRENIFAHPEFEKVKEVFASLGKMTWESFIVTRLRLLYLPSDLLDAVRTERIEYTKAQSIARIEDKETRQDVLEKAIAHKWSLNTIKEHISFLIEKKPTRALNPLSARMDNTYKQIKLSMRKNREIWQNPQTQERLEALLTELETLISTSP